MEMEVYGEKNKGEGMSCSQCKPILLHTCQLSAMFTPSNARINYLFAQDTASCACPTQVVTAAGVNSSLVKHDCITASAYMSHEVLPQHSCSCVA